MPPLPKSSDEITLVGDWVIDYFKMKIPSRDLKQNLPMELDH